MLTDIQGNKRGAFSAVLLPFCVARTWPGAPEQQNRPLHSAPLPLARRSGYHATLPLNQHLPPRCGNGVTGGPHDANALQPEKGGTSRGMQASPHTPSTADGPLTKATPIRGTSTAAR